MIDTATFWDGIAEKYAKSPVPDARAYETTLARTQSYLTAGDTVIELGCGTGSTALRLAGSVAHYTASDIAPKMTAIGRGKAAEAGVGNIDFLTADLGDPRLSHGEADAVLAFNLLHLVEDLPAALAQLRGMLKPGGLFISKTICLPDRGPGPVKLWLIRLALPVMQMLGKAPYVRLMRIADFERAMTEAGFEIVETGNYPARPPSRFIVARKL